MSKNKRSSKSNHHKGQRGGGSDWASSFYAYFASPAELSYYTLQHIDQSPMFNPLQFKTVIPTGTSGIIPTGVYLASHPDTQINSRDYNLKSCEKPKTQSPPAEGEQAEMEGGAHDYSFYHPSPYPGCHPYTPEYIGATCAKPVNVCGTPQTPGTDQNGRLERCKIYYSSTSSYGPGCGSCASESPSVYNRPCSSMVGGGNCPCSVYDGLDMNRKCGPRACVVGGCEQPPNSCRELYQRLSKMSKRRLYALCSDNYVRVYHIDRETGRLTPRSKDELCHTLSRKLAQVSMI